MTITLRGAIIGVLAVALCIGIYLLWLWRPEHQIRLHTEHFFHAIDGRNWESVADFVAEDYRDRWDNDRTRLLERMREGFPWGRLQDHRACSERSIGIAVDKTILTAYDNPD